MELRGDNYEKRGELATNDQRMMIHKPLFHEISNYRPVGIRKLNQDIK